MTRRKRRNHSAEFKVKVALAAIKGDHTLAELSTQFDLHQNQIIDWKNQLLEQSINIFSRPTACIFRDDLASDFGMSRPPISVSSGH